MFCVCRIKKVRFDFFLQKLNFMLTRELVIPKIKNIANERMVYKQRVTRGQGSTISRAPNHYGGAETLRRAPKSPNNLTGTFFNTVNLPPKELRFQYGGAKRASCPGGHLTSLRPCIKVLPFPFDLCQRQLEVNADTGIISLKTVSHVWTLFNSLGEFHILNILSGCDRNSGLTKRLKLVKEVSNFNYLSVEQIHVRTYQ